MFGFGDKPIGRIGSWYRRKGLLTIEMCLKVLWAKSALQLTSYDIRAGETLWKVCDGCFQNRRGSRMGGTACADPSGVSLDRLPVAGEAASKGDLKETEICRTRCRSSHDEEGTHFVRWASKWGMEKLLEGCYIIEFVAMRLSALLVHYLVFKEYTLESLPFSLLHISSDENTTHIPYQLCHCYTGCSDPERY